MNQNLPSVGTHPAAMLQDAAEHYRALEQRVIVAENEARDMKGQNTQHLNEVMMLRDQNERLEKELARWKQYASDLTTRLNVIAENVVVAIKESRAFTMKPVVPGQKDDRKPVVPSDEQPDQIRDMLERRPPAPYSTDLPPHSL